MNPSAAPHRAEINRANSLRSTGPRTTAGKLRSSSNALTHGLTARSAVLPTEDPAAYERHIQQFLDEYKPATPTESTLTRELADTAWRLQRIPLLEAGLLERASNPLDDSRLHFDIVDAYRAIASLGLHGQRLSRQFQKTLEKLRELQADRRQAHERDLRRAAGLLEMHKHKGLPYDPAEDGFVFSIEEIEAYSRRLIRLNQSRHIEHVRFQASDPAQRSAAMARHA